LIIRYQKQIVNFFGEENLRFLFLKTKIKIHKNLFNQLSKKNDEELNNSSRVEMRRQLERSLKLNITLLS
jgi:hypothetical protein